MVNLLKIGAQQSSASAPEVPESKVLAPTGTSAPAQAASPPNATSTPPASGGLAALFARKGNAGNVAPVSNPDPVIQGDTPVVIQGEVTSDRPAIPVVPSMGPADFQKKLQYLDSIIAQRERLILTDLDMARNICVEIMKDLKTFPEFDGMVRADDVHNLMVFVQSSVGQQRNQFALNVQKSEKKAAKAKPKLAIDASMFLEAFGPNSTGTTLDSLSGLNTDNIKPKTR